MVMMEDINQNLLHKDSFLREVCSSIKIIERVLCTLNHSQLSSVITEEAFIAAHNIKGAAMTLGIDQLAHASHELENCLGQTQLLVREEVQAKLSSYVILLRSFMNLNSFETHCSSIDLDSALPKLNLIVKTLSKSLDKNINFICDYENFSLPTKLWSVLELSLMHVLRNSCDHGIELKHIRSGLEKDDQAHINLKIYKLHGELIIKISDDGQGIEAQHINSIFKASFTTAKSVSMISGRGMGLKIVEDNIKSVGGDIQVQSISGVGTSFKILVPLRNNAEAA